MPFGVLSVVHEEMFRRTFLFNVFINDLDLIRHEGNLSFLLFFVAVAFIIIIIIIIIT
jgi:hypothetical protein